MTRTRTVNPRPWVACLICDRPTQNTHTCKPSHLMQAWRRWGHDLPDAETLTR